MMLTGYVITLQISAFEAEKRKSYEAHAPDRRYVPTMISCKLARLFIK